MKTYLVGGAVRDKILGLPVRERDWVVVGATAEVMVRAGFRSVPGDFPVFLHPETGEEYALARREVKTGPGYRGFAVEVGPDVTLEQDLARRDLTINAMAEDDRGEIVDPYGGQDDLAAGRLRHVTAAYAEDPVRLLRTARFAAKLGCWGFRVAHGTQRLMQGMVADGEVAYLRPERLWQEMRRALGEPQPWRFFEVLQSCGALAVLIPELAQRMGEAAAHAGGQSPGLAALRRAVADDASVPVRFAATFAGLADDAAQAQALAGRLRADAACRDLLLHAVAACPRVCASANAPGSALVALLDAQRAWQHPERLAELLQACVALDPECVIAAARLAQARAAAAAVGVDDLVAAGVRGAGIRETLARRRASAIDRALAVSGTDV